MIPTRRALLLIIGLGASGSAAEIFSLSKKASVIPAAFVAPPDWEADVALVPGGDPKNERTLAATSLLLKGRVERLLISGQGFGGDSAILLAKAAIDAGAPEDRILIEGKARTSLENATFSRPILESLHARRVLIVTSRTHVRRMAAVAEARLPEFEVKLIAVETEERSRFIAAKEALKLVRYVVLGRVRWTWLW